MILFVPLCLVILALYLFTRRRFPALPIPSNVLISGAGSGFGRLTSFQLAKMGHCVYSGVLSVSEGDQLLQDFKSELEKEGKEDCKGKIVPVLFDITKKDNVDSLLETLTRLVGEAGLQCLINNAGIAHPAPLELQPFEDFQRVMEVNLFGHVYVIQRFLPLLRKSQCARIINVLSLAGIVGGAKMSAYTSSKAAMEGLSDCLRRELRHMNISVSVIESGYAKTPLFESASQYSQNLSKSMTPEFRQAYRPLIVSDQKKANDDLFNRSIEPEEVVAEIIDAFCSEMPKTRYIGGKAAKIVIFLHWILPGYAFDAIFDVYDRQNRKKYQEDQVKRKQKTN